MAFRWSGLIVWGLVAGAAGACRFPPPLHRLPPSPAAPAPVPPPPIVWAGPAEGVIFERVAAFRARIAHAVPVRRPPVDAAALEARLALDPADLAARRALLRLHLLAGERSEARGQAIELCRRVPGAPFLVSDLMATLRDVPDAFADMADALRAGVTHDPRSEAAAYNCGRLLDLRGPPAPRDGRDDALFYLRRAVGLAPGRALYRETLADRLRAAGFLEEAREEYRAAAGRWEFGDRGEAYLGIAEIGLQLGDAGGARAAAQAAVADNGAGAEPQAHVSNRAHVVLGLVALGEGRPGEAAAHLAAAADVQPCAHTAADGLDLRLAEALAMRGRDDLAWRYARVAIVFNPSDLAAASLLRRTRPGRGEGAETGL